MSVFRVKLLLEKFWVEKKAFLVLLLIEQDGTVLSLSSWTQSSSSNGKRIDLSYKNFFIGNKAVFPINFASGILNCQFIGRNLGIKLKSIKLPSKRIYYLMFCLHLIQNLSNFENSMVRKSPSFRVISDIYGRWGWWQSIAAILSRLARRQWWKFYWIISLSGIKLSLYHQWILQSKSIKENEF